jgi:phage shock protein A
VGFADRLKAIVGVKTSAALDKAEGDPGQVFDYSYNQQLEQLAQLRSGLVEIVQNEKHIQALEVAVEQQVANYIAAAQQALTQNREDLARQALARKGALLQQEEAYKKQLADLKEQHEKIERLISQDEMQVQQFGAQKEVLKAQYQANQAVSHIGEVATGASKQSAQLNQMMTRAQAKVEAAANHADAIDALLDEGALGPQNMLGSGNQTALDHQLAQLTQGQQVDNELETMKARMAGSTTVTMIPPTASNKQPGLLD